MVAFWLAILSSGCHSTVNVTGVSAQTSVPSPAPTDQLDIIPPAITAFTMPGTATSLTVPVTDLTANDNVGVAGYLITESSTAPLAGDLGWTAVAPTSFTFSGPGAQTAYAWAKDAIGNISTHVSAIVTISLPDPNYATSKVLLDFNEAGASGTTWPGWTYYGVSTPNPSHNGTVDGNGADGYGSAGFIKNDANYYFIGRWKANLFGKNDYSNAGGSNGCPAGTVLQNDAALDFTDFAPSSSSGASFEFGQNSSSTCYGSDFWFNWQDNFKNLGLASDDTNRLDFYAKFQMTGPTVFNSSSLGATGNVHFGTYLCVTGECYAQNGNGESGVGKGGQGHFYHYLTVNPGAWVHILLDRHPNHERGQAGSMEPTDNETYPTYGGYFSLMNHFYFEIRYPSTQTTPTHIWVDELKLGTTAQAENDDSISSAWVGYWPGADYWEIGWNDLSFSASGGYSSTTQSTFEVRYSTSPITNSNFNAASLVTPLYNASGTNRVKRPNTWSAPAWTRFLIPSAIESVNNKLYFAIKDVSAVSNHDGHDSPNGNIHTIDYTLRAIGQ